MKTHIRLSALASYLLLATFSRVIAQTPEVSVKTTVCQLLRDRKAWDHKLVEVSGFASHGFEDSSFSDPECPDRYGGLWMEYGGELTTGTVSTAGNSNRTRPEPVVVEGISVPVVDDAIFHRFDEFLHQDMRMGTSVHATVVARFFAGRIQHYPAGDLWGGYGHMGCCSLFVIQQVLSVDDQRRPDLDYSDTPEQPTCFPFQGRLYTQSQMLDAQRRAEHGEQAYAFTSDHDVAVAAVKSYVKNLKADDLTLKIKSRNTYRSVYVASVQGSADYYMIVLSRPYWLSLSAADPTKVAWVVLGSYKMPCGSDNTAVPPDRTR